MNILNPAPSARQVAVGLFVIRVVVGIVFIAHGAQKMFAFGIGTFGGVLEQMGVPAAGPVALLVVLGELAGGAALVLGLFTRLASAGLGTTMVGAIVLVHLPEGFFMPEGYAFALTLLAAAMGLAVMGGGAWSVDAILTRGSAGAIISEERRVRRAA
jgi:putative oxidoreductase